MSAEGSRLTRHCQVLVMLRAAAAVEEKFSCQAEGIMQICSPPVKQAQIGLKYGTLFTDRYSRVALNSAEWFH